MGKEEAGSWSQDSHAEGNPHEDRIFYSQYSVNAVNPTYKRILIIKPSSLGDIIHALPTLAALRDAFPESWIAWLVKREWAEILEGHPDLNEVL